MKKIEIAIYNIAKEFALEVNNEVHSNVIDLCTNNSTIASISIDGTFRVFLGGVACFHELNELPRRLEEEGLLEDIEDLDYILGF